MIIFKDGISFPKAKMVTVFMRQAVSSAGACAAYP